MLEKKGNASNIVRCSLEGSRVILISVSLGSWTVKFTLEVQARKDVNVKDQVFYGCEVHIPPSDCYLQISLHKGKINSILFQPVSFSYSQSNPIVTGMTIKFLLNAIKAMTWFSVISQGQRPSWSSFIDCTVLYLDRTAKGKKICHLSTLLHPWFCSTRCGL